MRNPLDELAARGLIQDVSDRDALGKLLASERVPFYAGFDPTAASLHAGNLVPLRVMAELSRAGHHMIAVSGGATGMIGDPSGRHSERTLLDDATIAKNLAGIGAQIARFVAADATMVNNKDWFGGIGYLEFLREVGKHVTVNYMLAKDSVRARLNPQSGDREQGITYTEFSYMLLQAYDFVWLARHHGCRLQVGGSDQWGNITCGIELARKLDGKEIFGLVAPLLLTASGEKFGKSTGGMRVWLDPNLTSPYRFYQYWLNASDDDVAKYLRMFTFVPLAELAELVAANDRDRGKRLAQRRLAAEVTSWVHGAEATRRAEAASHVLFGGALDGLTDADLEALVDDVPSTTLPRSELEAGLLLVELLARVKLAASKGAARRLLEQGGVYVNNVRVTEAARSVTTADLATESMLLLRCGKKDYHLLKAG